MRGLKLFPECFNEGRQAFIDGIRTVDEARLANPYQGFDSTKRVQHIKYVSWNRGWNAIKQEIDGLRN